MKSEKLQNAIGLVDDDLCDAAENPEISKRKRTTYYFRKLAPIAAVLVILIAVGAVLAPFGSKNTTPSADSTTTTPPYDFTIPTPSIPSGLNRPPASNIESDETLPFSVATARYPAMAQYPQVDESTYVEWDETAYEAWINDRREQRSYLSDTAPLDIFSLKSMQEFLKSDDDENLVYSPVNVFMALAMCAEIADGNTRQQILDLLGAKSIEDLRDYAYGVWNASYCDDGTVKSILANSLWLNDEVNFNKTTLETLANYYFASSFSGVAGSDEFTQALRDWINAQTGNLLKDEVNTLEITPETVMSLVSTIYFKAKWAGGFNESNTKEDIFYSKDGELTCDFMNDTNPFGEYYWGDNFSATPLGLSESGKMWLVLPDEGVEVNDLISDPELQDFLLSYKDKWENQKTLKINLSLPKFDTRSTIDLKDGLANLGVTDCFDMNSADFSALTDSKTCLSAASHSARVMVDEEGVIATAFTVMTLHGAPIPPDDEVDFILNRPFLFFIENEKGIMLFSGVVNNP